MFVVSRRPSCSGKPTMASTNGGSSPGIHGWTFTENVRTSARPDTSGGAVFWGPYVLGDASYVNSLTCNATGSYQRDDTTYSRNFLNRFLP